MRHRPPRRPVKCARLPSSRAACPPAAPSRPVPPLPTSPPSADRLQDEAAAPAAKKAKTAAAEPKPYLPRDILWRQKEQFSDGVGYGWIDALRDHANDKITDEQLRQAKFRFPHNTPSTKEAYFYRQIFASHFPNDAACKTVPGGPSVACSTAAAIEWDASFKNNADPSGRAVAGVHDAAYKQ